MHHSALQKDEFMASCVTYMPPILLMQKSLTNNTAWQCRWRHIITDAFLVILAACFTAFTVIKVRSAQRDVGGSFWKAVEEHPQLANDGAICIAQWTGDLCVLLLLKEQDKPCRSCFWLLLAGLALYVTFAVRQCIALQPQPYYDIYDSDEYAQARFFLLDRMEPPLPPLLVEGLPLPPPMLATPTPAPLSSPSETSRKLQSLADGCWSALPAAEQPDPGLDRLWPHVPRSHAESFGDADPIGHARHLMVTNTTAMATDGGGPDRWKLPRNTTGDVHVYSQDGFGLSRGDTICSLWQHRTPPLNWLASGFRISAIPSICQGH